MCRLLETIKIKQGKIYNLSYHQKRFNLARQELLGKRDAVLLVDHIKPPAELFHCTIKCRIIYHEMIEKVEYIAYQPHPVHSLKMINADELNYQYKWENREPLNQLLLKKENCDNILILKNNQMTDTTYSNIIFFDGINWLTPAYPLLKGTKRAQLLNEEKIREEEIKLADLKHFKKAKLINAMLDFENETHVIPIENIIL